jgi:hypothetical protein
VRLEIAIYEHSAQQKSNRKADKKADKERSHVKETICTASTRKTPTHIQDLGIRLPYMLSMFAVSV